MRGDAEERRLDLGAHARVPEVRFELDAATSDRWTSACTSRANQMVEEMMLLANVAAAEASWPCAFPSRAMLRRHPTPAPRMFDPLLRACAAVNVPVDVSSSKALADSLDAATRPTTRTSTRSCASSPRGA